MGQRRPPGRPHLGRSGHREDSEFRLHDLALGRDAYAVSGGWFDQQKLSPARLNINGCTYGGSVIRHDVIAGRGLFLEFGNNVVTTRIQDVQVARFDQPGLLN